MTVAVIVLSIVAVILAIALIRETKRSKRLETRALINLANFTDAVETCARYVRIIVTREDISDDERAQLRSDLERFDGLTHRLTIAPQSANDNGGL